MSVLVIASYIVATALALSRILASTKPYWAFVPSKIAALIPPVVAMLPLLAEKVGLAKTQIDLVQAFLVAGALLLPGAGASEKTPEEAAEAAAERAPAAIKPPHDVL